MDLRKKYDFKSYAVLSRELALHKIATASCLTDRVYWALILSSACGPDVREGCFLRKESGRKEDLGRLVTDEKGQIYPLRVKHLLQILGLTPGHNRIHVSRAIRKLISQGCLEEHDPEKVWYPVLDPKRLAAETKSKQACSKIRYNLAYTFLPPFLRKILQSPEHVSQDVANSATTVERLKSLSEDYKKDLAELQSRYKQVAENALFSGPILIEEELEELEDIYGGTEGGVKATSSVEEPEQPKYFPPSPPAVIPKPQPEPVTAVVVSKDPAHKLFEVFCFLMDGCGRPVSVPRIAACRQSFFRYPPQTQQRIIDDVTIRSQGKKWDDPTFVTDPLKYLNSQIWDTEPITARKFAPARPPTQKEKADAAMKAHLERVFAREEGKP